MINPRRQPPIIAKKFLESRIPPPPQTRDPPPRTFQWKMFKLLFKLFPLKFLSTLPIVFSNASVVGKHSKYASSFCMSDVTQSRVPQKNRPARGTDGREWKYRVKLGESYPASLASLFSTRRVLFYRPVSRKSSTAGSPQGWRASTPRDIRQKIGKKQAREFKKLFESVLLLFFFCFVFFFGGSKKWRLIDSRSSYWLNREIVYGIKLFWTFLSNDLFVIIKIVKKNKRAFLYNRNFFN